MIKILFCFIFTLTLSAQTKTTVKAPDSVFADCNRARVIKLTGDYRIGPTLPPSGTGTVEELNDKKKRSKYSINGEHNSAWYRIEIGASGYLCFNIIPVKKDDDYDFMLFKGRTLCDTLAKIKINPARACISRNKVELDGKTGVSDKGLKELINEGPGDAYVKPLPVIRGEVYYLLVDNVYANGQGHTIYFYLGVPKEIAGVITDENDKPVRADITLTNARGDTIVATKSKVDGSYKLKPFLNLNGNYGLNFYNDSSFVYSRTITIKDTVGLSKLNTVLPKLKRGKKYSIGTINFYPGSDAYLPVSLPAIKNLRRLMQKNDSLQIMIIGHTNGCGSGVQQLSEWRALTIKSCLKNMKISPERIETKGLGCQEMLYPAMGTEWEQQQNRRVEIMVLRY